MSENFPTVGLAVDLSGIDKGTQAYRGLKAEIAGVGDAAEKMTGKVVSGAQRERNASAEAGRAAETRAAKTTRAAQAETRAQALAAKEQERARKYLQQVRIRSFQMEEAARRADEMSSARAAAKQVAEANRVARETERTHRQAAAAAEKARREETRAATKAAKDQEAIERGILNFRLRMRGQEGRQSTKGDAETLAFRQRMWQQQRAELATQAAAEAKLAAQREKDWRYLHGVKMRSIAMEEAARKKADATAAADARRLAADATRAARATGGGGRGGGGGGGPSGPLDLPDPGRVNILTRAFHGLRQSLMETRRLFFDVRTAIGVFLAGMLVRPVLDMADAMTALRARAGAFTEQASDVPYLMEAIFAAAQRSRAPLESIATLYTRLAPLAKQLGKSQLELLRISETVAKGFQIGGATPEEAKSSAQQLAQALASNRLGGDELRSLAENAPILMAKIAQALNMNTGQFIKWAHSGKANAAVIVGALETAQGDIDRLFAKFPVTVSQSVTLVRNALTNLVGKVNEATGASAALAFEIAKFATFLQAESTINGLTAAVRGIGSAFKFAGETLKLMVSYLPAIAAGIVALTAGFAATRAWTALMRAQTIQMLALNAAIVAGQVPLAAMPARLTATALAGRLLASAMVTVRAALLAVFSPVNLLIGALTLIAIGVNAVSNATKAAKNAFHQYDQSVISASSAIQRAIDLTDAYGGESSKLNKILGDVIGTVDDRVVAEGNMNTAAERRLRLERLMAEAALTTAAADARAAASAANRQATILGVVEPARAFFDKYTPQSAERRKQTEAMAADRRRNIAALKEAADLQTKLAASLDAAKGDLKGQPLRATAPNTAGPPLPSATTDNKRNPFEGALDRIEKMKAAIEGLKAEIASINANPLAQLAAQIKRAGDEAAASLEGGDKQNEKLAAETRSLAMEKERLTIIKQMIEESAVNTQQIQMEADANDALGRAQLASTEIMKAFWASGERTLEGYNAALQRSRDVNTEAEVAAARLSIAQRHGVDSIGQISDALVLYTGVGEQYADSVQRQAAAEAAATETAIRRKAALDALAAQDDDLRAFDASSYEDAARVLDHMTLLADNLGDSLAAAFGRGGAALGRMLNVMTTYAAKQQDVKRRTVEAMTVQNGQFKHTARSLEIEREGAEELAQARIQGYADMAAAAASFFKEGSTGYKVLHAAEMAFRLFEFAMSAKSIAIKAVETAAKIGFFGAQAQAAAAAGAANMFATLGPAGFAAVAAMVAVLAGFGLAVSGGGGGNKGTNDMANRQKAQGAGSVLGDAEAKSESIARALEIVASNTNKDLEYSNAMVDALRSIDNNISNLTVLLARQLQLSIGAFSTEGLNLGKTSRGPSTLSTLIMGGPVGLLLKQLPVIGGIINTLFGTTKKTTIQDQGLQFGATTVGSAVAGGLAGSTYTQVAEQTKKRFLGLTYSNKTKVSTTTGALDAEVQAQMAQVIASLRTGVLEAAGVLGVEGAAAALDAMVIDLGKISLKDMTGEQIEEALNAIFGKLGDDMAATAAPFITSLQKVGEGAFETLVRVAREYQVLDVSLKSIGLTFGAVGVASLTARQRLIDLAGGIDQLAEQTAFYAENFLTDAERIAPVITAVYTELGKLGYGSIKTKDEFKALVRGLDLTTEQGAQTFAMLMKLAPGFAQIVDFMDGLTAANDNVSDAQGRLNDAYNAAADLIGETRDKFAAFVDTFKAFRQQLETGPLAANSPQDQYLKTKALFETTSARALGGDEQALADLTSVGEAYLQASRDYYASTEPYFRDLAAVKGVLDQAQAYAQTQVDKADQQLAALNLMVAGLITINTSVLTVAQAIAAVEAAVGNLNTALAAQAAAMAAAQAAAAAAAQVAATTPPATSPTATTPTTPAALGPFSASGYLAYNPDIGAAADQLLATADRNSPWFREHGLDRGREGFAQWHWETQGQYEEGRRYAKGAAFDQYGVVDTPTAFNDDWMAEENPEAIMPLVRGPGGSLGVQATGGGGDKKLLAAVQELTREVKINNILAKAGHQGTIEKLGAVEQATEEVRATIRTALAS